MSVRLEPERVMTSVVNLMQSHHKDVHFYRAEMEGKEGSCAVCHREHSGEVRGWIQPCKSGTNYTPAASSSLREFRIGSCEKPSTTHAAQP